MNVFSPGLQFYVDKIKSGQPFTFIRYGDGEWSAILNDGRQRTGTGSHALDIPQLQKALRRSLKEKPDADNYFAALRTSSVKPVVAAWLATHVPGIAWHDCTVFYKASKKGRLHPLLKAIREQDWPVVLVGPPWLRRINHKVFKVSSFVEIPARDCWHRRKSIGRRIMAAASEPSIISLSMGPAAKVMAWWLYREIGQQSTILDLGSLWDVYAGRRTRQYHKGMKAETIKRNLEGE
jgi:hypothetical protein